MSNMTSTFGHSMCGNVTVFTQEIRTIRTMQDGRVQFAKGAETAMLIGGLVDPEADLHLAIFLVFVFAFLGTHSK